jgi:hypothetical protein
LDQPSPQSSLPDQPSHYAQKHWLAFKRMPICCCQPSQPRRNCADSQAIIPREFSVLSCVSHFNTLVTTMLPSQLPEHKRWPTAVVMILSGHREVASRHNPANWGNRHSDETPAASAAPNLKMFLPTNMQQILLRPNLDIRPKNWQNPTSCKKSFHTN